jgi:hypothetical protein
MPYENAFNALRKRNKVIDCKITERQFSQKNKNKNQFYSKSFISINSICKKTTYIHYFYLLLLEAHIIYYFNSISLTILFYFSGIRLARSVYQALASLYKNVAVHAPIVCFFFQFDKNSYQLKFTFV